MAPPGGFQSAAHRRCAVRARSPAKSSSAKCQDQSQMANLKGQAHSARLKSYTPPFFSPQEGWDDRNPVTKFAPSAFSGLLNRFFCSSRVCFKNDFEKTSKKCENHEFWLPKTFPKSIQNAFKIDVQKICDFSSIFARILMLVARANIKKTCAHAVFC